MKEIIYTFAAIIVIGSALIFVSVMAGVVNLEWLPFAYHQQTKIVHASQGYIDSQRSQLRAFKSDYDAASNDGQRHADLLQIRELADHLQPEDVQPDIAALLSR